MSEISFCTARFGCFGVFSHFDQFSTCIKIVVFQFIIQVISVRAYYRTFSTQGNNIDGSIKFPRILRRVEFLQLCTISLFRRPSPTCPADRKPLSREKVS